MVDPSDGAQETLREFLQAEKGCPDPPAVAQDRVLARLTATLGLVADPGDVPTNPAGPSPSLAPPAVRPGAVARMLARNSGRGLATFLVGAAVGASVYGTASHIRRSSPPLAPPAGMAIPAQPEILRAVPEPALPTETAVPKLPAAKPAAAPTIRGHENDLPYGEPKAQDRGLAAERRLVEMARTALTRGQTDGAMSALRRHARLFPRGQLAEERDGLLVQALVAKGDFTQARARAEDFYRMYPHSLFSPVVDQALKSIP